jgi:putative membrane protein insertion efficiency factor
MTAGRVTLGILALVALISLVDRIRGARRSTVGRLVICLVRAYQKWISPVRPPACRFTPTCSAYAITAIERHGALRGGWLTTRRLLRCGPWHPGGHDPVPPLVDKAGADHPRTATSTSTSTTQTDAATSTPTGAPRC